MRFIKVLLLLALFVFSLLFFMQNMQPLSTPLSIQFNLYPTVTDTAQTADAVVGGVKLSWKSDNVPLYFVVLASFAVGILFATACLFLDRIRLGFALLRRKSEIRGLSRQVKRLNEQLAKEAKALEARTLDESKELPESAKPATAE